MIYDITHPVSADLAEWPGDTPYHFELNWKMNQNSPVNVGTITTSVHLGTHIDAPFHFNAGGEKAGALDLTPFLGRAVVVEAATPLIGWDTFQNLDFTHTPRVLVKTNAWLDTRKFPETFPVLSPDVPALLGERGVVLFGIDVPSVDVPESKALLNHHHLYQARIALLEGLNLRDVPTGAYQLSALPLRLMDADGSPVRAILWTE